MQSKIANLSQMTKALIAGLYAVQVVVGILLPDSRWTVAVTAGIGTFLIWFVPNTTPEKPPATITNITERIQP